MLINFFARSLNMACLRKRSGTYYVQYYVGSTQKRVSLRTGNYQLANAAINQLEHRLSQGHDSPLPTRTPIADAVQKYLDCMRAHKSPGSYQKDANIMRLIYT